MLNKNTLFIALIFSGLVHGIVLFYKHDDVGDAVSDQTASVTVQVDLVAKAEIVSNEQKVEVKVKAAKEIVVVQKNADIKSNKDLINQQEPSVNHKPQIVAEADIVTDYSDVQISKKHNNEGERANKLRKYVYEAISRERYYPYIARKQRREGLVKLNFVMHPDGQVTDVLIVQSSRYSVLDEAAKQAVEAISPFELAAEYLNFQHDYIVDIDFRLN